MRLASSLTACAFLPLLLWQASSCHSKDSTPAKQSRAANQVAISGQWGGADIALEVTSEGININFDCAHGNIDKPVVPDSGGNFSVKGTYAREHGGAMRSEENPDTRVATYKGQVNGEKMTLTVTFSDGTEDVGPFTLERGKSGRVHKCM